MIIPVKCFTCGKVIAHMYEEYLEKVTELLDDENLVKMTDGLNTNYDSTKTKEGVILDNLGINRYCCRRHFLTQSDFSKDITKLDMSESEP